MNTELCNVCERFSKTTGITSVSKTICDACKKFFWRYHYQLGDGEGKTKFKCICKHKAVKDLTQCRACRFRKCSAIMNSILSEEQKARIAQRARREADMNRRDFSKIPCKICECSSSGIHFGVVSCEGCKGFFRRSMTNNFRTKYLCKTVQNLKKKPHSTIIYGEIPCPSHSSCRQCRLKRCIAAGMRLGDSIVGRHTSVMRQEIEATIDNLAKSQRILVTPRFRRIRKVYSDGNDDSSNEVTSEYASELGTTSNSRTFSDSVFLSFSPSIPATEHIQSLELSISGAQHFQRNIHNPHVEASEWLIDRILESVALLAPIASVKVIFTPEMTSADKISTRSGAVATFLRTVGEFMKSLPGASQISIPDRIAIFLRSFFPILTAQLSLNFDSELEAPNHMGMDRPSGTWCALFERGMMDRNMKFEQFLRTAGSRLTSTVTNIKEFALFCALLCFDSDIPRLDCSGVVRAIRSRYELALIHYFSPVGKSERRLGEFYELLTYFRYSTILYHDILRDLPERCGEPYPKAAHPLLKEFQEQFKKIITIYDE